MVDFMSRWLVLISLLASGVADAKTAKTTTTRTSKKAEAKKKKTASSRDRAGSSTAASPKDKTAKRGKKKKGKREPKVPRIPDKTTNFTMNMPKGWAWPPTKTMKDAEKVCEAELDQQGITWERAKPEGRIVDPISIPGLELGGITYAPAWGKGPVLVMDCQFARTMATFGSALHDLGVRQINFGSVYRYTTVRVGGKSKNILSRHALGIAMDVVSFVDENGRVAVVKTDYLQDDPLLLSIEEAINKSGKFRTVLTPRNDPISHDDHFHIEAAVDYKAAELP